MAHGAETADGEWGLVAWLTTEQGEHTAYVTRQADGFYWYATWPNGVGANAGPYPSAEAASETALSVLRVDGATMLNRIREHASMIYKRPDP